jgi:hypothetical protein
MSRTKQTARRSQQRPGNLAEDLASRGPLLVPRRRTEFPLGEGVTTDAKYCQVAVVPPELANIVAEREEKAASAPDTTATATDAEKPSPEATKPKAKPIITQSDKPGAPLVIKAGGIPLVGLGLFLGPDAEPIKPYQVVGAISGVWTKTPGDGGRYAMAQIGEYVLDASEEGNEFRFMNHSNGLGKTNAFWVVVGTEVLVVSKLTLHPNQQIVANYAKPYWERLGIRNFPMPEERLCSKCKQTKSMNDFSKSYVLTAELKCKACTPPLFTPDKCTVCSQEKDKESYSKKQWKQTVGTRTCKDCNEQAQKAGQKKVRKLEPGAGAANEAGTKKAKTEPAPKAK